MKINALRMLKEMTKIYILFNIVKNNKIKTDRREIRMDCSIMTCYAPHNLTQNM